MPGVRRLSSDAGGPPVPGAEVDRSVAAWTLYWAGYGLTGGVLAVGAGALVGRLTTGGLAVAFQVVTVVVLAVVFGGYATAVAAWLSGVFSSRS